MFGLDVLVCVYSINRGRNGAGLGMSSPLEKQTFLSSLLSLFLPPLHHVRWE